MSARVIGVVRGRLRLEALTYDARPNGASPWLVEHVCELRLLEATSVLWPAWHALASVSRWDPVTLQHVVTLLDATVPALDAPDELPALPSLELLALPRATAAHPRAFRGTKHRPPRPSEPEPIDVRPYLLARRHIDQVIARCGGSHSAPSAFESAFVTYVQPVVRRGDVGAFAARARAFDLACRPDLRAALVGLVLAAGDHARALAWWDHVHASKHQLETAQLVIASGAATRMPPEVEAALACAARTVEERWRWYRLFAVGASPAYIESGFALGVAMATRDDDLPHGQHDVTATVESTIARLGDACDEDSGAEFWRRALWELCGHQPEAIDVLAMPELVALEPEAAFQAIRLVHAPRLARSESLRGVLHGYVPVAIRGAATCAPKYQRKLVEDIYDAMWWMTDEESVDVHVALTRTFDVALRLAREPFGARPIFGHLFAGLSRFVDCRSAIRDAPDASWLALEAACSRTNDARLIAIGFIRLTRAARELGARAFAAHPSATIDTAKALAAVSLETADEVVAELHASPLAGPSLVDVPIAELCAAVESISPSSIRRALREHLAGTRSLSDAQLCGHRARIISELDLVRLAAIRHGVARTLAARVGVERLEGNARHAAEMLGDSDENRRQFRRMVTATLGGDRDWVLRHPRTRDWFTRHPRIDRAVWLGGFEHKLDDVTLAIELDPLEALKLGTYVGSCLGRGGHFAHSAAAVVLDVNKQVVYARDARGSVVARQLVAISDADELVCFWVYGQTSLASKFRDFDQLLADRLGVPISRDDRTISNVLSQNWFDDGDWDGTAE
ncbi:MAG TPA: hypothetical protein VGG74_02260 [Kofleriaceae bacterium]|jgi:hypothetical protein